jgi:hypothetical protein
VQSPRLYRLLETIKSAQTGTSVLPLSARLLGFWWDRNLRLSVVPGTAKFHGVSLFRMPLPKSSWLAKTQHVIRSNLTNGQIRFELRKKLAEERTNQAALPFPVHGPFFSV